MRPLKEGGLHKAKKKFWHHRPHVIFFFLRRDLSPFLRSLFSCHSLTRGQDTPCDIRNLIARKKEMEKLE